MNIHALLPLGIRDGHDTVGADAFAVLAAGVHLDRRNARSLGWRGLRPSMGTGHAWTLRVAGREGVYGLAFLDEERSEQALYARFSVFYFPDPGERILSRYAPAVADAVSSADYYGYIREFSSREDADMFFLGVVRFDFLRDLTGVNFSMEAQSRQRVVALEYLPEEGGTGRGVAAGGLVCDVPSLLLAVPFCRLVALSCASLLEAEPAWSVRRMAYPVPGVTARGEWKPVPEAAVAGAVLRAVFGRAVPPRPEEPAAPFLPLAGRAFARKEQGVADFRPVLHIVSGFLGSGKTTFLAEWLAWLHNHDRHTAVLQNEIGEKNLDAALLAHETLSESLDEGCVCCTLADSLRPAVRRLLDVLPTEQIILETTGLANPGAVGDVMGELGDMVRPGLIISMVDALDLDARLTANPATAFAGLAGEQVRRAGVLVLNKEDRLPPERLPPLAAALERENPAAVLFHAAFGRIPFGELERILERGERPGAMAAAAFRPRARYVTHQDEGYASLVLEADGPISGATLAALVEKARDRTPRIKGIIDSLEHGRPMVVQYAAGILELEELPGSPGADRFLVLIGKDMDGDFTASLTGLPGLKFSIKNA